MHTCANIGIQRHTSSIRRGRDHAPTHAHTYAHIRTHRHTYAYTHTCAHIRAAGVGAVARNSSSTSRKTACASALSPASITMYSESAASLTRSCHASSVSSSAISVSGDEFLESIGVTCVSGEWLHGTCGSRVHNAKYICTKACACFMKKKICVCLCIRFVSLFNDYQSASSV